MQKILYIHLSLLTVSQLFYLRICPKQTCKAGESNVSLQEISYKE